MTSDGINPRRTAEMEPDDLLEPGQARSPAPTADRAPARRAHGRARRAAAKQGLSVRLEGLRAFYGESEQVKGVDLDFRANEVTAIIGPSGCGKSTMVRCINRMHEEIPGARAEGRVLLDELDVYDSVGRRRRGAPRDRDGLPEAEPVPDDVDLRQRRRRPAAVTRAGAATCTARSRPRCAAPGCGRRSPSGCPSPAPGSPAASSSGCASRARSPSTPR